MFVEKAKQQTIDTELLLAEEYLKAGQDAEAEQMYLRALNKDPESAIACQNLGLLYYRHGHLNKAIAYYEKAIECDPNNAINLANLAEMYRLSGNVKGAIEQAKTAVKKDPGFSVAYSNLGIAYYDAKQLDEAYKAQTEALKLDRKNIAALNNMASIFKERGEKESAVRFYYKALKLNPDNIEVMSNLAATLVSVGKPKEALPYLEKALKINPRYVDAYCNQGYALLLLEMFDKAEESFNKARELLPSHFETLLGVARLNYEKHQLSDAHKFVLKALKQNCDSPKALTLLGLVDTARGYPDDATKSFKKALEINPDYIEAINGLANLYIEGGDTKKAAELLECCIQKEESAEISSLYLLGLIDKHDRANLHTQMLQKLAKNNHSLSPSHQIYLYFALGKMYEDLKEYDQAFLNFMKGNRLKRSFIQYSAKDKETEVSKIKKYMNKAKLDLLKGFEGQSDNYIFIVGMPRSGSTLLEQMLSSHSKAFGAGELYTLFDAVRSVGGNNADYFDNFQDMDPEKVRKIADFYRNETSELARGDKTLIDKMPANFLHTGLIHVAFPNSKIIHIKRNPLDTCVSCFKTLFSHNQNATYDLTELGHFYKCYTEVMRYWKDILPEDAFFEISYETLVAEPKPELKKLLDFCDFEWEDSCLSFYEGKRNIRTASFSQVRQPVYNTSIDSYKRYTDHLGPLMEALDDR
jgi:Tfp pilus assembly protein PilF